MSYQAEICHRGSPQVQKDDFGICNGNLEFPTFILHFLSEVMGVLCLALWCSFSPRIIERLQCTPYLSLGYCDSCWVSDLLPLVPKIPFEDPSIPVLP